MEPALYRAAMGGIVRKVNKYTTVQLESQITRQSNNILHVAAMFGHIEFVKLVLQKCPHLLQMRNNKLETPLHIAAKKGHPSLIEIMLDHQECVGNQDLEGVSRSPISSILRAENADGDTALHVAARVGRSDVVELLAKADPESSSLRNKGGKTPLYIAAERNDSEVVLAIMENCDDLTNQDGPDGKTIMHAATYQIPRKSRSCIGTILRKRENFPLVKVADEHGWLPLHYAAYYGFEDGVKHLLRSYSVLENGVRKRQLLRPSSTAYETTRNDGKYLAIHLAAANGYVETMKVILNYCPDCWEAVDGKGRNILDIARYMEDQHVIDYIASQLWSGQITDQPVKTIRSYSDFMWAYMAFFRNRRLRRKKKVIYECYNYTDPHIKPDNNGGDEDDADLLPTWKCALMKERNKRLEKVDSAEKMAHTHLIVAALIATVTFTAGFTVPGGYKGNDGSGQGLVVLSRLTAFKVFAISNSIALSYSLYSIILYFIQSASKRKNIAAYRIAATRTQHALVAMTIAFIAGSFAVLKQPSIISIATCIICYFPITLAIQNGPTSTNFRGVVELPSHTAKRMERQVSTLGSYRR